MLADGINLRAVYALPARLQPPSCWQRALARCDSRYPIMRADEDEKGGEGVAGKGNGLLPVKWHFTTGARTPLNDKLAAKQIHTAQLMQPSADEQYIL